MDKTTHYRQLIKDLLTQYAELVSRQLERGMETHLIFDDERDEYLWLQSGWSSQNRVYGTTLHVRLHNGKIWIEQDWTALQPTYSKPAFRRAISFWLFTNLKFVS
jgi:hypothetical protein